LTLPPPSPTLPAIPQRHELNAGDKLVRFYHPAHGSWDQQRFYGPLPGVRFDHHLPPLAMSPDRSVWYSATFLLGAVAEAFGNLGFIDKGSGRRICVATLLEPLKVLDLVGVAARALSLDQRIATSTDYPRCHEWARSFYDRYPEIRGLRWRGRQAGSICVVLNDRVDMGALHANVDHEIAHPDVWPRIARAARRARLRLVA
jgi:hypothetical protein